MLIKKSLIGLSTVIFLSIPAFAGDKDMELSKEQREQMAQMHTKMADCLRSDKTFSACHDEMYESCKGMDMKACPMMDKGMKKKWKKDK